MNRKQPSNPLARNEKSAICMLSGINRDFKFYIKLNGPMNLKAKASQKSIEGERNDTVTQPSFFFSLYDTMFAFMCAFPRGLDIVVKDLLSPLARLFPFTYMRTNTKAGHCCCSCYGHSV